MNKKEDLVLGMGWGIGQLSFRLVEFMVGAEHTQVEMPVDLESRRAFWARFGSSQHVCRDYPQLPDVE